jgi:Zn-dependent protease with chaperone function
MKAVYLSVIIYFLPFAILAQTNTRLFFTDDSTVQQLYLKAIAEKKKSLLAGIPKTNAKDYKQIYTTAFESIETFVKSKAPITDKEANKYLQQLVNHIIAGNAELSNLSLRVVFSRDYWPNAYSMGDGTIAFNAGLFIYLQNEAEVVFVLCHEIAHYYLEHQSKGIQKYVETVNNADYQKQLKAIAKQEFGTNAALDKLGTGLLFNNRKHSRDNEAEADSYGLKFMQNTMYNPNAFISCMQILDKIDDSLLTKPLDVKTALHSNGYAFKQTWIEEESSIFSEIKEQKEEDKNADSLKTHPDCKKRIALLKDAIAKTDTQKKVYFSSSPKEFEAWKEKLYFELIEYCYTSNYLSKNLYYSLALLQSNKELPYAIYSIGRCFNTIYEKQKNHSLGLAIATENKNFNTDYNQLLKLLSKVSLDEIAAINYFFCKEHAMQGLTYKGFEEIARTATKNYSKK